MEGQGQNSEVKMEVPITLEYVERRAELKAQYEECYVLLQQGSKSSYDSVITQMELDKTVLKAYIEKYHPNSTIKLESVKRKWTLPRGKGEPRTLEGVERNTEWKARYERAYTALQKNPKSSIKSIARSMKITGKIFKQYIDKYYTAENSEQHENKKIKDLGPHPTSLEEVEADPDWRDRFDRAYAALQRSRRNNFRSVSIGRKLDIDILKAWVDKYYPEYNIKIRAPRYALNLSVREMLSNIDLKLRLDFAVQQVLKNKYISWLVIATQLGVTLDSFVAYVKHVEPSCTPTQFNLAMKNAEDRLQSILNDPPKKAMYDKIVNAYLTNPLVTLDHYISKNGITEFTLTHYIEKTVPNHEMIRSDLMAKYKWTMMQTSDISMKREYIESIHNDITMQDKLDVILNNPTLKSEYDDAVDSYVSRKSTLACILECFSFPPLVFATYLKRSVPDFEIKEEIPEEVETEKISPARKRTSESVRKRSNTVTIKGGRKFCSVPRKTKMDKLVAKYLSNPAMTINRLAKMNNVPGIKLKSYLDRTVPDHPQKRAELITKGHVMQPSESEIQKGRRTIKNGVLDEAVKIYLTDRTLTLTHLAEIYSVGRLTLKKYMERTVPDYVVRRAELMEQYEEPKCDVKKESVRTIKKDILDEVVSKYLTDSSVTLSQLAEINNVNLVPLQKYLERAVPDHAEKRAKLLTAPPDEPDSDLNDHKETNCPPSPDEPDSDLNDHEETNCCPPSPEETPGPTNIERTEDSFEFEDQGLCYNEVKNCVLCSSCNVVLSSTDMQALAQHCRSQSHVEARNSQQYTEEVAIEFVTVPSLQGDPLDITELHRVQAPKDSVGPGENSWAAQTSQAPMPSTSRAKEMSPRPSTSATHTGGFLIKQDPGTPPPVQQQVMNPYIQEPPMVQSAPRLLPKPSVPPPQSQVQQQPRLRVRQPQHVAPAPAPPDPDPEPQQVCLRWNSFHNNMQTMFPTLLNKEKFVDVTLACEGQTVKCHKVVLSSCSAYIERLLTENPCKHPIILMPNTMRYWQIRALVDFMYRGEVNVEHEQLSSLLAAAEFLQVKGLAGPPTSPEQNTNMEDPEPEPPLSPRPKRKRVASPSPVPQHRQPVATPPTPQPQQQQQQQQQRTSLPNSPAVSITRLKQSTAVAQATPSTSRDTGSRAQSPGIEITPVVSFEEIKMEPIDISDSNDESMDPNMHCDVDYDMDNGDGEGDKDYDDEDLDEDSGDAGRGAEDDTGGGGGDADPGPSLQPSTSDDQPGTSKTTSNGPDLTTPGFSGNGIEIDDSAASYCAADLGLTTEPPEDPPDSGAGPSGL